jgi:hypothetical protein
MLGFAALYETTWNELHLLTGRDRFNALNVLALNHQEQLKIVAWVSRVWITRGSHKLSPSEFRVVVAAWERTLGWSGSGCPKIAEEMPLAMLEHGMLTKEGQRRRLRRQPISAEDFINDKHGLAVFAGTKLSRNTLMTTLDKLAAGDMLERIIMDGPGLAANQRHAYLLKLDWPAVLLAGLTFEDAGKDAIAAFVVSAVQEGEVTLAMIEKLAAAAEAPRAN